MDVLLFFLIFLMLLIFFGVMLGVGVTVKEIFSLISDYFFAKDYKALTILVILLIAVIFVFLWFTFHTLILTKSCAALSAFLVV